MKYLFILCSLIASTSFAQALKFETVCKDGNCFKNGWMTTSKGYSMETRCKRGDCPRFGWSSRANDQSTYDVNCRTGGCFKSGWSSTQVIKGKLYFDDVLCKNGSCLQYGWVVRTGYDFLGGNVVCNNNDCSKFGGTSIWRGRPSRTACYSSSCYTNGWTLFVY